MQNWLKDFFIPYERPGVLGSPFCLKYYTRNPNSIEKTFGTEDLIFFRGYDLKDIVTFYRIDNGKVVIVLSDVRPTHCDRVEDLRCHLNRRTEFYSPRGSFVVLHRDPHVHS